MKKLILLLFIPLVFACSSDDNNETPQEPSNFFEAKDSLNEQLWTVLHLSTIIITLATLILNILIIICWKSTD